MRLPRRLRGARVYRDVSKTDGAGRKPGSVAAALATGAAVVTRRNGKP